MSKSLIRVRTSTLVQIAAGTFLLGSTGLYLLQRRLQGQVRDLPHYKESFEIISRHEQLLENLGKPIQVGRVDLADREHNFVGKETSELRIPLSGPLSSGYLTVLASRPSPEGVFKTDKLLFEGLDGDFLVYEK